MTQPARNKFRARDSRLPVSPARRSGPDVRTGRFLVAGPSRQAAGLPLPVSDPEFPAPGSSFRIPGSWLPIPGS